MTKARDKAILTALDESITHWMRMRDGNRIITASGEPEEPCSKDCALCELHQWCDGCPIYEKTGEPRCDATPFYAASDAFYRLTNTSHPSESVEFKKAAGEMIIFLVELKKELEREHFRCAEQN